MDEKAGPYRRTSSRLQGRSHPKVYTSDHDNEDDEIQVIPTTRRGASRQREPSKQSSVGRQKRATSSVITEEEYAEYTEPMDNESEQTRTPENEEDSQHTFHEDIDDEIEIPSILANLFKRKPQHTFHEDITAFDEEELTIPSRRPLTTDQRILKILDASRQEIETNPALQERARRKPYSRRSSPLPSNYSRKRPRPTSPQIDLETLSKRECPVEVPKQPKGITLTSIPIDETDTKYTMIKGDDNDASNEVEVKWPDNVEQLEATCVEPPHECTMVEFMRKKILEAKRETRYAWETVKELSQKAHDKEKTIRQFRTQFQNERTAAGLSDVLVGGLKEARMMSSYATLPLAARRNSQFIFHTVMQHAFPHFSDQDFKQIFQDSVKVSRHINIYANKKPGYVVEKPKEVNDRSDDLNMDKKVPIRRFVESSNEETPNCAKIQIHGAPLQQVKTMVPLAVIPRTSSSSSSTQNSLNTTPQLSSSSPMVTPQLLPKSSTTTKKILVMSKKGSGAPTLLATKLHPDREKERKILKLHPTVQYASPTEKARFLGGTGLGTKKPEINDATKQALPFAVRPIKGPTLVRKFPTPSSTSSTPTSTSENPRQSALEFAILQRALASGQKRSIPVKMPAAGTRVQLRSPQSMLRAVVNMSGRTFALPQQHSSASFQELANATERAQQENKRRLERLLPVKQEPDDPI